MAARRVVILHPGTRWRAHQASPGELPDENGPDDARASDEPSGTWHRGRLNYVLFSGELHESAYAGVDLRWGSGRPFVAGAPIPMVELSYLWSDDHAVLVASPPDTAGTIALGPDALLDRLISLPELRAREWPTSA